MQKHLFLDIVLMSTYLWKTRKVSKTTTIEAIRAATTAPVVDIFLEGTTAGKK